MRAALRSFLAAITVCPSPRHVNNGPNQVWSRTCDPGQELEGATTLHVRPHFTFQDS